MTPQDDSAASASASVLPLVRRRALRFGLIMAAASIAVEAYRHVVTTDPREETPRGMFLHLVAAGIYSLTWVLGRSPDRSLRFVQNLETCVFLAGGLCHVFILQRVPSEYRPELLTTLLLTLALLSRGIYVPSSTRRTALLCVGTGVPFIAAVLYKFLNGPDGAQPSFPAIATASFSIVYWVVSSLIAVGTSHVVYGLRREVGQMRRLGQYVLEDKLGEGGMGVVYRARHALLRRPTAIKLLPPEKLGVHSEERFEREVQITARLSHPHTVTVFDFGRTPDGVFYYAMELLEGAELGKVVAMTGQMPPARVARIMADVAGALAEAHELSLIHRDIKPANIMLCWRGGKPDVTKVLDFGLAKELKGPASIQLTGQNVLTGTPLYLAPEVVTAPDTVSARSDLYALGCVAYFLLTGQTVFNAETAVEIAAHHVRSRPVPPSERTTQPVPAELEALIMACLEKDPSRRPASASELEQQLLPMAAGWTERDARAFWSVNGACLKRAVCPQPRQPPETIAVDWRVR